MRTRRSAGALRGAGLAAALGAAALGGFVAAALVYGGPKRLRERSPIGPLRAFVGGDGGEDATTPRDIPALGWVDIVRRTAFGVAENRLMTESAAVTFYALLALFPALAATVSLYGLFADPAAIQRLVDGLGGLLPPAALQLLHAQLNQLIANGSKGLSTGVVIGLATTLWSANQGSKALFDALNVVYREEETRSYVGFVMVAMLFTLGAILFVMAAMVAVVAVPDILAAGPLTEYEREAIRLLRWPVILGGVGAFLASLYRFGPSRENAKWRWVSWGGLLAALCWIAVSALFSWYVQTFGSFDRTYGSLGTVVGFMVWIWLSTLTALCGAQLNSEMEHQTAADTTTGLSLPMGVRGATQANTVA